MIGRRKVRAVLRLAVVSAGFWGTAAALAGVGVQAIAAHSFAFSLGLALRLFGIGAALGLVGGLLFGIGAALVAPRDVQRGLSGGRAALAGAVGGLLLFMGLRFTLMTDVTAGAMVTVVVPGVVFGLLGAGTALGKLGTASRAKLTRGGKGPVLGPAEMG